MIPYSAAKPFIFAFPVFFVTVSTAFYVVKPEVYGLGPYQGLSTLVIKDEPTNVNASKIKDQTFKCKFLNDAPLPCRIKKLKGKTDDSSRGWRGVKDIKADEFQTVLNKDFFSGKKNTYVLEVHKNTYKQLKFNGTDVIKLVYSDDKKDLIGQLKPHIGIPNFNSDNVGKTDDFLGKLTKFSWKYKNNQTPLPKSFTTGNLKFGCLFNVNNPEEVKKCEILEITQPNEESLLHNLSAEKPMTFTEKPATQINIDQFYRLKLTDRTTTGSIKLFEHKKVHVYVYEDNYAAPVMAGIAEIEFDNLIPLVMAKDNNKQLPIILY